MLCLCQIRWCTNEKNGVVMTGYTTEGTLSRTLLTHPETVEDMRGNVQVRRQTDSQTTA
jgi:Cft2 family RNA processing exonuclease